MEFFTSPVGAAISFAFGVVGVLGVIISIYFYLRSRRDLHIGYDVQSFKIITNNVQKVPRLQLTYEGKPIPNVTVSNILIFNSGDIPIKQSEIDDADPLAVTVKDGMVLEARVLTNTTSSGSLNIKLDEGQDNSALLLFEYLNPRDGAVINVVHTGKRNSDVEVTGKVIGFGTIRRKRYMASESTWEKSFIGLFILFSIITIVILESFFGGGTDNRILGSIILMIPLLLTLLFHQIIGRNYSLPKEFRNYYKDS